MIAQCACADADSAGHEFVYADSDQAALGLLHSDTAFDLALVSVDGGQVSGLGIFHRLVERSLRVPRVALTDGRDITRIKTAIGEGAADIMLKPLASDDFNGTLTRVMQRVERRRQNWHERAAYMALRREIDLAADMQRRILPQRFPERADLDVSAIMRPARGVGGDFYDIFVIDDDHIGALIADVSGKGIPAAFYMAVASTTIHSIGMNVMSPGACLAEVNEYLVGRDIPGMFMSVFYAVINTSDWTVRCANAGHSPPLVRTSADDDAHAFDCGGGPILGILAGQVYAESELSLAPGDSLLLYTDGVTEAYDTARRQFGGARLADILGAANGAGAEAVIAALDDALAAFVAGAEQHDDITAMAVRRSLT